VARARGRFGKTVVAAMLSGSKSAKLARWNLDRLSTFGLLSHLTQSELLQIMDVLIDVGLLVQTEVNRFRPVVQLTDRGRQVMQGKVVLEVSLPLPGPLCCKLSRTGSPPAAGDLPAPPTARAPHAAVQSPVAQPRLPAGPRGELEGSSAQREPCASGDAGQDVPASGPAREMPTCPRPSFYWTWRLLADGYSAEHCAAIRRLTPDQVLDHAVQAAEDGLHVDCRWLLTSAQLDMARDLIARRGLAGPQLLVSALPAGLRHQHLQLFLKAQSNGQ
jgi:ATP-dependent DNA helicase RecQ